MLLSEKKLKCIFSSPMSGTSMYLTKIFKKRNRFSAKLSEEIHFSQKWKGCSIIWCIIWCIIIPLLFSFFIFILLGNSQFNFIISQQDRDDDGFLLYNKNCMWHDPFSGWTGIWSQSTFLSFCAYSRILFYVCMYVRYF